MFPPGIEEYTKDKELLGINVQEIGKERAFIKVIARMLSLRFDSLWQRWQREKRLRRSYVATMLAFLLIIFYFLLFLQGRAHRERFISPIAVAFLCKNYFNGTEQYIGSLDTVLILDNIRPYYKGPAVYGWNLMPVITILYVFRDIFPGNDDLCDIGVET